jgi:hypothetical protein
MVLNLLLSLLPLVLIFLYQKKIITIKDIILTITKEETIAMTDRAIATMEKQ